MAVADLSMSLGALSGARAASPSVVRVVRIYFLIVFVLSLAAVVFAVEGRFPGGLFLFPPSVDWVPPLSSDAWLAAFSIHQQDPVFAACGGASSLEEFRTLYGWEWLRRGSVLLLGTASLIGLAGAGAWPRYRFALPRLLGLCLIGLALALGRVLVGFAVANVDDLARFNVGQYRHAVDLTFASLAVGAVLASVVAPPLPAGAVRRLWPSGSAVLWLFVLLLDICFGALFLARDAATAWTGWPGIADFPPLDRFASYDSVWLNLVFNPYAIQLVHRGLSAGLWLAALLYLAWTIKRNARDAGGAAALFGLLTAQMAIGVSTLVVGTPPPALSIAHRVGGVLLVAAALLLPRRLPLNGR